MKAYYYKKLLSVFGLKLYSIWRKTTEFSWQPYLAVRLARADEPPIYTNLPIYHQFLPLNRGVWLSPGCGQST